MAEKKAIAASQSVKDELVESAEESHISVADVQRSRSHPARVVVFLLLTILAATLPYGWGRSLALNHTKELMSLLAPYDPRSMAFLSWAVTTMVFMALGMVIMDSKRILWGLIALLLFSSQQFLCGLGLVKTSFWYGTQVVYGSAAGYANALNVGVFSSGIGLALFLIAYLLVLVSVKKTSSLNILTRSWMALLSFFLVEVLVMILTYLGGFVNMFIPT